MIHNEEPARALLDDISEQYLREHCRVFAQWAKEDGTEGERLTARYIEAQLRDYGLDTEIFTIEALISLPVEARFEILAAGASGAIPCITHSFAASTAEEGLTGEVAYVGNGTDEQYAENEVRGRVALIEGVAKPEKVALAERFGAVATVFINDDHLHEMAISTVWGSPSTRTIRELPAIPCISILRQDGERLKKLAGATAVPVHLRAKTRIRWEKLPFVSAKLAGVTEPDRFVLVGTHIDAWYIGATDNSTGIAAGLELARVFSQHRGNLRRGIRFLFWPGHSQGRYAGSTWYADRYWEELYEGCVAQIGIDAPGMRGATIYSQQNAMAELTALVQQVVKEITGQDVRRARMPRSGDQSFWGIGVPSCFVAMSLLSARDNPDVIGLLGQAPAAKQPEGGIGWWWHTADDTPDKVDTAVLTTDTRVFASAIFRLTGSRILPLDYAETARELAAVLEQYHSEAGHHFSFEEALRLVRRLEEQCERLNALASQLNGQNATPEEVMALNACLIRLGRLLIPINYTISGPFEQDAAVPIPPLPGLQPARQLAALAPNSDEFRLLTVDLVRQRNRTHHALRQAVNEVEATLRAIDRATSLE